MKRRGYYHLFPFNNVAKGESVIIYGMGEVGHHYVYQLHKTNYCNIEFVTDSNWNKIKRNDFIKIEEPSKVISSDSKIIIANGNKESAEQIKKQLINFGVLRERIIWTDVIIDEEIVVNEEILLVNELNQVKRKGHYHIFPFSQIDKKEKIIIWGAGEVGRNYIKQIERTKYCDVLYVVDSDWTNKKNVSKKVYAPDKLCELKSEKIKIVIANGDGKIANEIKSRLDLYNINYNNIIWNDMIISADLFVDEIADDIKNNTYKPCIGTESELSNRQDIVQFAKSLFNYDIISFDIFDTLLFRPFIKPTDLFMVIGNKIKCIEFPTIRINAEKRARDISALEKNNREVSLDDIYKQVYIATGLDVDKIKQIEIETEIELCYANPYMLSVYNMLKRRNKKIVFTSDMYLRRKIIKRILEKCGYADINEDDVFVSVDYSVAKCRQGLLYQVVMALYGNDKRIIHIGDNYQSDIVNAKQKNIDAIYYKGVNELGKFYRPMNYEMTSLVGSAYCGIINSYIHNGLNKYTKYYELGFIHAGLFILGYANWINQYVKKNNIDKVIFLARDCYIIQQVYNLLPDHINNEYALWSRMAAIQSDYKNSKYMLFNRLLKQHLDDNPAMTVYEWMKLAGIEDLCERLYEYNLLPQQYLCTEIEGIIKLFINDNWQDILKNKEENNASMKEYFARMIGNAKNVAIVDLGWAGTSLITLKQLLEDWFDDLNVECLLGGIISPTPINNSFLWQSNCIEAYLFSEGHNRDNYNYHKKHLSQCNKFFELICQDNMPSFKYSYYSKNNDIKFVFDTPEVENKNINNEIHKGIIDFAKMYLERFKTIPWMYNISGYDAFIPAKFLVDNPLYFKNLEEFSFFPKMGKFGETTKISSFY